MDKLTLILALAELNKDLLIDNVRLNTFGEIVVETTNHHFYIYRDEKWIGFKKTIDKQ